MRYIKNVCMEKCVYVFHFQDDVIGGQNTEKTAT